MEVYSFGNQCLIWFNSFPPGQNVHHFEADDIFKYIFMIEKFCISIQILLNFVPEGLIDNNPVLV